jgi:hypothetical protein
MKVGDFVKYDFKGTMVHVGRLIEYKPEVNYWMVFLFQPQCILPLLPEFLTKMSDEEAMLYMFEK